MVLRKRTRQVRVGAIAIGGDAPVSVQSMTNTRTSDVDATVGQIEALAAAGCDIVRIAVPDAESAAAFGGIRRQTAVPLVADVHFQYRLAIAAIDGGADKIRINPGNIGSRERVREVVNAARQAGIPIRIGVNAGSLEKELLRKYGGPTARALVDSACGYIRMMEEFSFGDLVLSIKASDVPTTVAACRLLADATDLPQHIGITEAGTVRSGTIRSAVGIGALLAEGIGDTIRVSLCGDPVEEVFVAREVLKSLGHLAGPTVIACPTCGRCRIDVASLARRVEEIVAPLDVPIKVAVMGCVVNGPGEARDADVGIAGANGEGEVFVAGECVARVKEEQLIPTLRRQIQRLVDERRKQRGVTR